MANKNKISATLSDADKASIIGLLRQAQTLMPFLISINIKERNGFRKMGPKSVNFVQTNLEGVQTFPHILPASFDAVEFRNDVALVNQLTTIQTQLSALLETVSDTLLAAGSDAMMASDTAYGYFKQAAKNDAAVKTFTAKVAQYYSARGKPHNGNTGTAGV